MSRRYGGIHFANADLAGRRLGRLVADQAWKKAEAYFDGASMPPAFDVATTGEALPLVAPR